MKYLNHLVTQFLAPHAVPSGPRHAHHLGQTHSGSEPLSDLDIFSLPLSRRKRTGATLEELSIRVLATRTLLCSVSEGCSPLDSAHAAARASDGGGIAGKKENCRELIPGNPRLLFPPRRPVLLCTSCCVRSFFNFIAAVAFC